MVDLGINSIASIDWRFLFVWRSSFGIGIQYQDETETETETSGSSDLEDDFTWFSLPDINTSGWFDWADFSFDTTNDETDTSEDEVETFVCKDTDVALVDRDTGVYEIKGTCYDEKDRGYTDYCTRGYLIEYYCRTDYACSKLEVNCEKEFGEDYACVNGACVQTD
jgi:hypothetical protein